MVNISAERINLTAPYHVVDRGDGDYVYFTTDYGVRYRVGFERLDLIKSAPAYEFVIINVNQKPSPRDSKLRETVMAVVYDFFLSSELAMLYICETGDGKQSLRDRLFHFWLRTSPQYANFGTWDFAVTDEEGIRNYITLIVRNDNPKIVEVAAEITETVRLLNEKPQ